MSNKLYEEALVDAKKIREVAEENAKKVILESVTPKIREFIESQILEKEDKEDKEDKDEDDRKDNEGEPDNEMVELDESAIHTLLDMINSGQDKNLDLSYALNEAMNRLSSDERKKLSNITQKMNTNVETLKGDDLYTINEEKNMPNREKFYEIDLNTLRNALSENTDYLTEEDEDLDMEMEAMPPEEDDEMIADLPEGEDGDNMVSKDDIEAQIEELIADLGLEIGGEPAEDVDMEMDMEEPELDLELDAEEDETLEEVFEVDPRMLQNELRRIRRRVNEAKGQGLAHEAGGIAKDYEHLYGGKGSANAKGGDFGGGKPGKDVLAEMKKALRNQRRNNSSLQNKLTKYRSAVNTLREQLEELNLFNAKLLYVNKLLQNKTISESQKRSIVQALDEAKDLREAKVLYKSLTESFGQAKSSKGTLTESTRLGGSSRTTRSASSTQASGEVNRWAKLAGLK